MIKSNKAATPKSLWLLGTLGILSLVLPFWIYRSEFNGPFATNDNSWSNLGSYIGGISGTVLNFLTFIVLIWTFRQQYQDSKIRDDQDIFFKLLSTLASIIADTEYVPPFFNNEEPREGERAYRSLSIEILKIMNSKFEKTADENDFESAYKRFYLERVNILGHYFRFVYNILKFLDNSALGEESKKQCVAFLKAYLSQSQLTLIFINCIFGKGKNKFKPLIEKYSLFDNLDLEKSAALKKLKDRYSDTAYE